MTIIAEPTGTVKTSGNYLVRLQEIAYHHYVFYLRTGNTMQEKMEITFEPFFTYSTSLLCVTDFEGKFIVVNPAFEKRLGWPVQDLEGRSLIEMVHPEEGKSLGNQFREAAGTQGQFAYKLRINDRRGGYRWLSGQAVTDSDKNIFYCLMDDITDFQLMEQQLRASRLKDDLTGLYNKQGFFIFGENYMNLVPRQNKVLALMRLQVEKTREIRETFGSPAEEEALVSLAKVFKDTFRKADIISRTGPKEFCILGMVNNKNEIDHLRNRLEISLEEINKQQKHPFHLTVSLGAAFTGVENQASLKELFESASP
ncbi:diguanylate cyclase domain-containing protein [Fibrobacterota bacterium]